MAVYISSAQVMALLAAVPLPALFAAVSTSYHPIEFQIHGQAFCQTAKFITDEFRTGTKALSTAYLSSWGCKMGSTR